MELYAVQPYLDLREIIGIVDNFRDYVVIGSDSGRIVILFFDTEKNIFEKI